MRSVTWRVTRYDARASANERIAAWASTRRRSWSAIAGARPVASAITSTASRLGSAATCFMIDETRVGATIRCVSATRSAESAASGELAAMTALRSKAT